MQRNRLVAISRSPLYSPRQDQTNDAAILEATLSELKARGWLVRRITERAAAYGELPPADLYVNMGQGPAASAALLKHETGGARFFNRPSSVLGCHRDRLVPALLGSSIAFPKTVLLPTDQPILAAARAELETLGAGPLWLKRGGVHPERPDDVVALASMADLPRRLREFSSRGIARAAVQVHVPGPVVKFYGVAGGALFHAYLAESGRPLPEDLVNHVAVRALAFRAAARLSLDVFGGDMVVDADHQPILIDLNDWPSFAPIRDRAAHAIAGHIHAARSHGALR